MKKFIILIALLFLCLTSTSSAQVPAKPFSIYASAGMSYPMSPDEFKDGWDTGYHANAQLGFSMFPKAEIVLNLGYHKFGADADFLEITSGGDKSAILTGVDFKVNLGAPMVPIRPFLIAGAGIAFISTEDAIGLDSATYSLESDNRLYYEIGGGIEFKQLFVRAKFVTIRKGAFDENDEEINVSMLPVSIGLRF